MMQDFVRTSTYQKAILSNLPDFGGKVVLDVGAGSGILSFFAQQAGAAKVRCADFEMPKSKLVQKLNRIPQKFRFMRWKDRA